MSFLTNPWPSAGDTDYTTKTAAVIAEIDAEMGGVSAVLDAKIEEIDNLIATIPTDVSQVANMRALTLNVADYGPIHTDGSTSNQETFEAAIADVPAYSEDGYNRGGCILEFPPGALLHTAPLVMPRGCTFRGAGQTVTHLVSQHTGNGIESHEEVNGSHPVYRRVDHMSLYNGNGSNTGAGFDEICGTFVSLHQVNIRGFKRGIVFDQTEVSTIDECNIEAPLDVGLWLVNGDDHATGAAGEYTNRITVSKCNFNANGSVDLVVDDGGYAHTFDDCNFNGGQYQIYAAAMRTLVVKGGEFESCSETPFLFTYQTRDASRSVGQGIVTLLGNIVVPSSGKRAVTAVSAGAITSIGNYYASGAQEPFGGLGNVNTFVSLGDGTSASALFTDPATNTFAFPGGSGQAANADTSGATLGELETEVNELKATLRAFGLVGT